MKYCSKCGKELPDEAKFCTDCGEPCNKNEGYASSQNASSANMNGNEFYSGNANGYNAGGSNNGYNNNGNYNYGYNRYGQNANNASSKSSGLKTAAKVFMIIGCAMCGVLFLANLYLGIARALSYLIPLCWQLPMTLVYFEKVKNGERVGTGFKVCSLLFVNIVAGILMLCDND